jgi:choice-of-anchor B domain-containing protein
MRIKATSIFTVVVATAFLWGCKSSNSEFGPKYKCVDGKAADMYPCDNVSMYAHLTAEELGGFEVNDIWGWTDPSTGKEYALVGLTDGVSFVDISDPNSPVVVGKLEESNLSAKYKVPSFEEAFPACVLAIGTTERAKTVQQGSTWRDMKVFDDHIFVVSDAQPHGVQSFDLTKLRQYDGEMMTFTHDALYEGLANAHNIAINEQTGFAYAVGVTTAEQCGSRQETGLHIIDVNDPKNPTFAGCFFDPDTEIPNTVNIGTGYIHDTQCVNYEGPDSRYTGKELCFSSAEGAVVISDVTDKSDPYTVGFSGQSEMQYSHQGWLTEDQSYFLMNDEIDEANLGRTTKTYIWDVQDLEDPQFVGYYSHGTRSIDHNLYIKNDLVYQSNYTSGLQILEIDNLANAELNRVGFFDTQPGLESSGFEFGFNGTWSNYPYFESGVLILSDIEDGLFILQPEVD